MTEPYVKLVNVFAGAFDNFIATARTCYSAKGIVTTEEVAGAPESDQSEIDRRRGRKQSLAQSLFKAGHHTTLQHAHAQFALDRVSRQFIWSFLHSHPFYNSEQVSQRYVEVKDGNYFIPGTLDPGARQPYLDCVARQMKAYHELCELLRPVSAAEYLARFPGRRDSKRAEADIRKRAQEVARYVLPVATHAYLYHTVSVITLLRYHRMSQQLDVPAEQRQVVSAMVAELLAREPEFCTILQEPIPLEETPEYYFLAECGMPQADTAGAKLFTQEFDRELGGAASVLADWGARNEEQMAQSVREIFGLVRTQLDDEKAIDLALNPASNRLLGESMNLTAHSKLGRALFHAHYTFRKKLSHTADSQDQRHRMTPASRPVLMRHFTGEPDYVTPGLILRDEAAGRVYRECMDGAWEAVNRLLAGGAAPEHASYLLPNAVCIRFTESADLLNLRHKMVMRLCFNAQEEIWRAALDEAMAVRRVNPHIGQWLLPPCAQRLAGARRPICPEGDRYCGVQVWRHQPADYARVI